MSQTAECPEHELLERLALGEGAESQLDSLAEHLALCDRCANSVDALLKNDTLVRSLAAKSTGACDEADEPLVVELIERLGRLPPPNHPAVDDTLDGTETPSTPGDAETADGVDLLAPPEAPDELGRLGGYRVLRQLGAGGMGVVFEAEDPKLRRRVALKVMKPALAVSQSARQRFVREAQATAAMEHDHIVAIYQVGEDRGLPFLAMPLLKGETLDDRLKREGKLPPAEVLRIGREMADGLAAAHARGLVHRDVKPANVWLESPRGRVKLLDFGLARAVATEGAAPEPQLTLAGGIVGTPAYMAPEQARGEAVDERTDLFSLGCVLYRMGTGVLPFLGRDPLSTLLAVTSQRPTPPREHSAEVPPALSDLVLRLLDKRPDARPASAQTVAMELEAIGPLVIQPHGQRRNKAFAMAAAAAVLLLGVVIVIRNRETGKEIARVNSEVPVTVDVEHDAESGRKANGNEDQASRPAAQVPRRQPAVDPSTRPGAAGLADAAKPFTLLRGGKPIREFKTAAGVLAELQAGDEIEIHGDGPFVLPNIRLAGRGLTLRAAAGYQPRFIRHSKPGDPAVENWIYVQNAPLTLEGCKFRSNEKGDMLAGGGAPWDIRRCRLQIDRHPKPGDPASQNCITIRDASLTLEGCEIRSNTQGTLLAGGGAAWDIRRCRLQIGDFPTALIHYDAGPGVRIADSFLVAGGSQQAMRFEAGTSLDFENNVFWHGGYNFFALYPGAGQNVRLSRSTFAGGGVVFAPTAERAAVTAENNVFSLLPDAVFIRSQLHTAEELKQALAWNGQRNLYDTATACLLQSWVADGFPVLLRGDDREGWNQLWGDREQDALFAKQPALLYQAAWLPDGADTALPRLRHWVDVRRLDHASDWSPADRDNPAATQVDVGPDWDLVGPGQAYLRALAAEGREVAAAELLPEGLETGPVVVVRDGSVIGAYTAIAEAVVAAADGDTVEIRSDSTFPVVQRAAETQGKRLTVRAGYGYRPTSQGLLLAPGDVWSIEGLHFTGDVSQGNAPEAAEGDRRPGMRLVNCSFDRAWDKELTPWRPPTLYTVGFADNVPLVEVVNCVLPSVLTWAGRRLRIVNSVIFRVELAPGESVCSCELALERCAVWSGAHYAIRHPAAVPMTVTARNTWFEVAQLRVTSDAEFQWQGEGNVYCHGPCSWQNVVKADGNWYNAAESIYDLPAWQARWPNDVGSRAGDAAYVDLRFYHLLPDSLGHAAAGDGSDLGADVSRIALAIGGRQPPVHRALVSKPAVGPVDARTPIPTLADERAVAEWVLKAGGRVNHVGNPTQVPCPIDTLELIGCQAVTDDSLARFRNCFRLAGLDLRDTLISDSALVHLASLPTLRQLDLGGTDVSDGGLKHLTVLARLDYLGLIRTRVSDAGLLAHARSFPQLHYLNLQETQITDAGIPGLATLARLVLLDLAQTNVTDAGLEHLKPLANLRYLVLSGTQVTDAGIAALQPSLPDCWITGSDGRVHSPPKRDDDPDRAAAERTFACGAQISIVDGTGSKEIAAASDLPPGPFRVTRVAVYHPAGLGDAELELLGRLRQLEKAELYIPEGTAAGLAHLTRAPKLEELWLMNNKRLTDDDLAVLGEFPRLRRLNLRTIPLLTNAGLRHLETLTGLEELHLDQVRVNDAGLEQLKPLLELRTLSLAGTQVAGPGLRHLAALKQLSSLNLTGTRVNDMGLSHLAALPGLERLELQEIRLTAEGLGHLRDLPRLGYLYLNKLPHFGDDELEAVAALPSLEQLWVSGPETTDAGLVQLARLTHLRALGLSDMQITDAALVHLKGLMNLETLGLARDMHLTDTGLVQLHGLAQLKRLDLSGTKVTEAGVAALKAALPQCEVVK